MDNDNIVEEIKEIAEALERDQGDSSAAFRLFEIAEYLVRGYINDFELEHELHDHNPIEPDENDEPADVTEPSREVTKTKPFSVIDFTNPGEAPSFTNMKRNINEWLEPTIEFDNEDEAIAWVKENVTEGAVLRTDWDTGYAQILYSITE